MASLHGAPPPRFVGLCSARATVAVLLFSALTIAYVLRAVLSAVIVPLATEFGYSSEQQGGLLSAFFAGYVLPQLAGGWAATRYGGWPVLLGGMALSAAATALCVAAAPSLPALLLARALVGVGQGVVLPSVHALAAKWAPPHERATLIGGAWSGLFVGTAIAFPVGGALGACAGPPTLLCGWRAAFYLTALAGGAWCVAWALLGASAPRSHAFTTAEEAAYIGGDGGGVSPRDAGGGGGGPGDAELETAPLRRTSVDGAPVTGSSSGGVSAPGAPPRARALPTWRVVVAVLRNPGVAALVCVHTAHNVLFYTLLAWLPAYLLRHGGLDVRAAGAWASAPYVACFAASLASGALADAAIARGVPVLTVRRAALAVSELLPAASLAAVGFVASPAAALALLTAAVGLSGVSSAGYAVNHLDLAPHLAGLLLGLSNCAATLPGIVAPAVVGWAVAPPHDGVAAWRAVFGVVAAVAAAGWTVFAVWGRAAPQRDLAELWVDGGARAPRPGRTAAASGGRATGDGAVAVPCSPAPGDNTVRGT